MDAREAESRLLALVSGCGERRPHAVVDRAFRVVRAMSAAQDIDETSWFALLSAVAGQGGVAGEMAAQAAAAHLVQLSGMRPRASVAA